MLKNLNKFILNYKGYLFRERFFSLDLDLRQVNFLNTKFEVKDISLNKILANHYKTFVTRRLLWLTHLRFNEYSNIKKILKDKDYFTKDQISFLGLYKSIGRKPLRDNFPFGIFAAFLKKKRKFEYLKYSLNHFCKICLKYTGSNIFCTTVVFPEGHTISTFSGGLLVDLVRRRDRYSLFTIRRLGQLIALRIYQTNLRKVVFSPRLDSTRIFRVIRYIFEGFKLVNRFPLQRINIYRPVARNGIRGKKVPRK